MRFLPTLPTRDDIKPYLAGKEAWVLPKEESALAPDHVWTNADLDPVAPAGRTWTTMDFFMYWISDLVNAGSFAAVASYASLGLTWWEGVLANMFGGFLVAITICLNGIVGATLHTPFAVTARSAYGYYGSKFPVISRMIIACFWMSINSYQAGIYLRLMISSIWPSFNDIPNTIPASQGTTSLDFLCFFLYTLLQFPFILIHPSKLRPLFIFKSVTIPATAIAMFIWACAVSGSDLGELMQQAIVRAPAGRSRFIAFMSATTASMGVWSTMANNIGDFSRYCKKPSAAYVQLFTIPFLQSFLAILGAVTAFSTSGMYGELLWQPYDIIEKWQVSSGGRAAAFFASLAWAVGQLTTNITANSISASTDIVSLCPKYFDIKRGQILVATVGVFGFAPWKVLMAAGNFITFMASYSIVLAPMAAILAADYFLVKRRMIDIPALYDPNGRYRFYKGWNWRAFVALLLAIAPNLPGMINAIQPNIAIGNIRYIYMVSNIWGATTGVGMLCLLSWLFPAKEALIEAPIWDLDDVARTGPEVPYTGEGPDDKSAEAEKAANVSVRVV